MSNRSRLVIATVAVLVVKKITVQVGIKFKLKAYSLHKKEAKEDGMH